MHPYPLQICVSTTLLKLTETTNPAKTGWVSSPERRPERSWAGRISCTRAIVRGAFALFGARARPSFTGRRERLFCLIYSLVSVSLSNFNFSFVDNDSYRKTFFFTPKFTKLLLSNTAVVSRISLCIDFIGIQTRRQRFWTSMRYEE